MTQTHPSSRTQASPASGRATASLWGKAPRFAVVGVSGVVVNMLALHLLYGIVGMTLLLASPLSAELAIVHNYLLNDRWTFHGGSPSLTRFAIFNLSALMALLVNVVVVWALVAWGPHYLVANLAGIGAGAALNFGVSAGWIWRGGVG
jgi:putative flippase GtrA